MDEIQHFVSEEQKKSLKHWSTESCLGNNKQRSKYDTQQLLFDVLHFDVSCIKLGSKHLKHNYKMGIF